MRQESKRARLARRLNGRTYRRATPNPMTREYVTMGIGVALLASVALFVPGDYPGGVAAMALRAVVLLPLAKTGIISDAQFIDWGVMESS